MADLFDIVRDNLMVLDQKCVSLSERRLAQLGELADLLCDEAGEEEIFFRDEAFLARYRLVTALPLPSDLADCHRARVEKEAEVLSVIERAYLCRRLCETLGITGLAAAGTFFEEVPISEGEVISYLKSSYADKAFDCFSAAMTDPKVLYGDDFAAVCENVYYGRCSYCILPVENTADGRLAGFRALIIKYGLKILSACRVALGQEGDTVFALLGKGLRCPTEESPLYFDVRVGGALYPLLTAAEACGMTLMGVASIPGREEGYDLVFQIDPDGLCGFLCFLHLERPGFIPIGISSELTSEQRK